MKKHLNNEIKVLCWRVIILYMILTSLRVVFYFYNLNIFQNLVSSPSEIWRLIVGCFKFDTVSIIYTNALWILLTLLPTRLRANAWYRKTLFWLYIITNTVLIIIINIADIIYYKYTLKRLTNEEFNFLNNDNNATLIGQFMIENWWLTLLASLFIYSLCRLYFKDIKINHSTPKASIYYPIHTFILILAIGISIIGIRGQVADNKPITITDAAFYTPDPTQSNIVLSNPFCIIRTLGKASIPKCDYFSDEIADSLFTPYHYPDRYANNTTKSYEGYNVVMIIMESFSAEYSQYLLPELYKDNDCGDTPFLDSLMRNSMTMKSMYANGTGSIKAMPSVLGSMPSFLLAFSKMPQSIGQSKQLPAILQDKGYETSFFCGSSPNSMGFESYASLAGVDNCKNQTDYEKLHGKNDYNGTWGIWDEQFLSYMGDEMRKMQKPFFASVFTICSHHPHDIPTEYEDIISKDISQCRRTIRYTDIALQKFYNKLSVEPWFDNTIFVFVADHVSGVKEHQITYEFPGNHHIIGFIHTPDGSLKQEINAITQQLDIMPTLLGLMDYKEPYFAFGRDIINEPERESWAIEYNNQFIANTNEGTININESDKFKALVQQYYRHIKKKKYLVE